MTTTSCCLACCGLGLALTAVGAVEPPTEDRLTGPDRGPFRRLFLDAMVVEESAGLERVFHVAVKHPANPVLRAEQAWEKTGAYSGPYLYGTVMWDEGKLRMWYHGHSGGYLNGYAESRDGVAWTKPSLGLCEYQGSKDNNLFLSVCTDPEEKPPFASSGQCHNPSVIKQDWEKDPAKRYALYCYGADYRRPRVAFSPDGLRWSFVKETAEKGLFGSGDVVNFCRDPYRQRFVATMKTGNRRGRAAGVAVSSDGLTWTKPIESPVMVADDLDPDATQIYGMPVFCYQGLYLGLPWIYNSRWFKDGAYTDQRMYEAEKSSPCTMDVQLAWSWDLVNWTRPPQRRPFIPRGGEGAFDSGMIYTARGPVEMGDELWFYYGGWVGAHNQTSARSNIGVATLRLDGFCSVHAGEQEGWLISRVEQLGVPRVTINAKTGQGGVVLAEVLDLENRVVPGFSRAECVPFSGDAVAHTLTWRTAEFPAESRFAERKIRFILKNADLYSYLPVFATRPALVVYDPRSGKLPDDPSLAADQRFVRSGDPAGFQVLEVGGRPALDLHSVAARKTNASYHRDADWTDADDWAVEAWVKVVDQGTEPNYGLAIFMAGDRSRSAQLYLAAGATGINTTAGQTHQTLTQVPMDTTGAFHWYRLVHEGGPSGRVALFVDGKPVAELPYADLGYREFRGTNVMFGPNAGHREGHLQFAGFGYRIGGTEVIFGPVP